MEDIKEVALEVAREIGIEVWQPIEVRRACSDQQIIEFASRLLAELQKDATPVAVCDTEGRLQFKRDGYETRYGNCPSWVKVGTKLFRHPQPKAATVPLTPDEIEQCFMSWGHPAQDFHVAFLKDDIQDVAKALFRKAAAAPYLPAPEVPPELDVRRIMIAVVPGEDGMGEEVYAKSVDDVVNCLTKLGEQVEDLLARPSLPAQSEERLTKTEQRMLHDFPFLQQFHTKYALGPKLPPSCLCCGQQTHPYTRPIAIQHAELPGLVICEQCRDAAQSEGEQK